VLRTVQKLLRAHARIDKLSSKVQNAYDGKRRIVKNKIDVDWALITSQQGQPLPNEDSPMVDDIVREFVANKWMCIPSKFMVTCQHFLQSKACAYFPGQQNESSEGAGQKDDGPGQNKTQGNGSMPPADQDLFSTGQFVLALNSLLSNEPEDEAHLYYGFRHPEMKALYRQGAWVVRSKYVVREIYRWANAKGREFVALFTGTAAF
jgi:hypothetical protein